jgi:hypothetical protein
MPLRPLSYLKRQLLRGPLYSLVGGTPRRRGVHNSCFSLGRRPLWRSAQPGCRARAPGGYASRCCTMGSVGAWRFARATCEHREIPAGWGRCTAEPDGRGLLSGRLGGAGGAERRSAPADGGLGILEGGCGYLPRRSRPCRRCLAGATLSGRLPVTKSLPPRRRGGRPTPAYDSYLVDSASSHMLVSKIKPCMSKYKQLYRETANGSLNQLSFI